MFPNPDEEIFCSGCGKDVLVKDWNKHECVHDLPPVPEKCPKCGGEIGSFTHMGICSIKPKTATSTEMPSQPTLKAEGPYRVHFKGGCGDPEEIKEFAYLPSGKIVAICEKCHQEIHGANHEESCDAFTGSQCLEFE
jgi:hypothetical protein